MRLRGKEEGRRMERRWMGRCRRMGGGEGGGKGGRGGGWGGGVGGGGGKSILEVISMQITEQSTGFCTI